MTAISKESAEHYEWGQICEGWFLVKSAALTVIEERLPPGASEILHRHGKSRQFFYVLAGFATMLHDEQTTKLAPSQGIEIAPGVPHRIFNSGETDLQILVISSPPSHGDREDLR